jgi:hypothetical protein
METTTLLTDNKSYHKTKLAQRRNAGFAKRRSPPITSLSGRVSKVSDRPTILTFVRAPAAARSKIASGAGQIVSRAAYLRAAQAYMLISMPTGTSRIFGVFQVI